MISRPVRRVLFVCRNREDLAWISAAKLDCSYLQSLPLSLSLYFAPLYQAIPVYLYFDPLLRFSRCLTYLRVQFLLLSLIFRRFSIDFIAARKNEVTGAWNRCVTEPVARAASRYWWFQCLGLEMGGCSVYAAFRCWEGVLRREFWFCRDAWGVFNWNRCLDGRSKRFQCRVMVDVILLSC